MSKLRIHELAKELDHSNKEIMDFLKSKQIDVKSHMSVLDEHQETIVRKEFASKKNQSGKAEEKSVEKPKKKSNIIQVVRPQNATSQEARKKLQQRAQNEKAAKMQNEHKAAEEDTKNQINTKSQPNKREHAGSRMNDRPSRGHQGNANRQERSNRPQSERTSRNQGDRNNNRTQTQTDRNNRTNRPQGERNNQFQGARSTNRPQGDRNNRPQSDRNNRPYGERNDRGGNHSQGDRNNRFQGNRSNNSQRPYGSKPYQSGDKNGRPPVGPNREKKHQVESMDLGLKKPSRDTNHKEKDKARESRREKSFGEDRRPNQGNRPNSHRPNQNRRRNSNIPKALQKPAPKPKEEKKEVVKEIILPEKLTVKELAEKMKMQPAAVVKKLFLEGTMVTVNNELTYEQAEEIALGYDIIAEPEVKVDVIEELLKEDEEDEKNMVSRPPVVCVMGHVDHGKTSLLDAIRNTHVTDREAGGITQHIGATVVSVDGKRITFLDTPGHEAFTAMRMRGANSTDIAVLVVAADDGVMPQTIEAINHAKAAGVEIIVAVNKIDKPGANVERVKQELSEQELIPEDWGGSTIFVPVSAHTHEGIKELLEMVLLTADVMELKADPKRRARGLVIEAQLDKGKGPVANILVQKGTLHQGDYIAAGSCSGKVRAMTDDKGRRVKEAGPSTPVEVLGLNDVPNAGEIIVATDTDKDAKNFADTFVSEGKNKLLEDTRTKMSLDDLFSQIQEGSLKELNIVLKADVQGSVEAMKQSLVRLSNEEVVVKIVHGGVGAITESDVTLAAASNAIIIGFNVRPDTQAKNLSDQEGVDMRLYRVIYQAIEDVEAAMKGMLDPVYEEKVIGHAEIRQLFKASGIGTIAGSYVLDGIFKRGCSVRITREGKQIFEGPLASLKRFKDDVKEVKAGYECGLVFDNFNDIQELDIVEAYTMVEVPR